MIRFPEVLLAALCLAAAAARGACIDAKDVEFLRGLNGDRQYSLAAFQAEIYRRSNEGCPPSPEVDLELAKALYQLGEFRRAREILKPHVNEANPLYRRYFLESYLLDFPLPHAADSALAWARSAADSLPAEERKLFESAALFIQGRDAEARAAWPDAASGGNVEGTQPESYLESGFKRPGAAAGLSILPGLGYVYAGQPGDGVFALSLISVFYGVAAYYAYFDSPARAWTFAGFGAVFHVSNVYGAQRAARETNRKRKVGFLSALHGRLFP
jgi:hypothetical protein